MVFGSKKKKLEKQLAEQAVQNAQREQQIQEQIRIERAEHRRKEEIRERHIQDMIRIQAEEHRREEVERERERQQEARRKEEEHRRKEAQWKRERDQLKMKEDWEADKRRQEQEVREAKANHQRQREQRRLEILRMTTPETLRGLRDLVRTRYELDMYIWSVKGARGPDRDIVKEKMEKADAVLMEIYTKVESWEEDEKVWTAAEWALAQKVKERILAEGKRWWADMPPWNDS
jgi:hypothetical protein